MLKDMNKIEQELNAVIIPDKKKKGDEEVVKFPVMEVDENRKVIW
jgi:hypothetical protein